MFLTEPSKWYSRLHLAPHVQRWCCCEGLMPSFIKNEEAVQNAVVMNSLITGEGSCGDHSVIEHSRLMGNWKVGSMSFVSQIRSYEDLVVKDGIAVQEIAVNEINTASPDEGITAGQLNDSHQSVLICYGVEDPIKAQYGTSGAMVCGQSWDRFFEVAGVSTKKVWPREDDHSLWSAKLFPVLSKDDDWDIALWIQDLEHASTESIRRWRACERISLSDILTYCNPSTSFEWRKKLNMEVGIAKMEEILRNGEDKCVLEVIKKIVSYGDMNDLALEVRPALYRHL